MVAVGKYLKGTKNKGIDTEIMMNEPEDGAFRDPLDKKWYWIHPDGNNELIVPGKTKEEAINVDITETKRGMYRKCMKSHALHANCWANTI